MGTSSVVWQRFITLPVDFTSVGLGISIMVFGEESATCMGCDRIGKDRLRLGLGLGLEESGVEGATNYPGGVKE